jgi:transposase
METRPYLIWVAQLRFAQIAEEATRQDYLHEVEHMRERVARLKQAIAEAVKLASPALRQVINDLQALRGIGDISAVTIAAKLGQVSRFDSTRQLMGYCGAVPSEDSSGKRIRRGGITKTGNAHLRRIVVEAAWSYRRPLVSGTDCAGGRRAFPKRRKRLRGRHSIGSTSAIGN